MLPLFLQGQSDPMVLSLQNILELANAKNITIQKQNLQRQMALDQLDKSKEWWLPNIFIGTRLHHLDGADLNTDGNIFREIDRQSRWYGGELNASWDFGQGLLGSKADKLRAEGIYYENIAQKNETIVSAIEAYYNCLIAKAKINLVDDLILVKINLVDQLRVQEEAELRLKSELLLAQGNLQRLKAQRLTNEQLLITNKLELAQLLRLKNIDKFIIEDLILAPADIVNYTILKDTLDLAEHPAMLQYNFLKSSIQKKSDYFSLKGILLPTAGFQYTTGPFGGEYSDADYTNAWQGYFGWDIPLGQLIYGGDNKRAATELKLIELEEEEMAYKLNSEVSAYKSQLSNLAQQIELMIEAKDLTSESLQLSIERENVGIGSSFEVLQAQEEFLQVSTIWIEAIAQFNVVQYKLFVAQGGNL